MDVPKVNVTHCKLDISQSLSAFEKHSYLDGVKSALE